MGVKDLYNSLKGDYEEVFAQLGNDDDILGFLKKFIEKDEMEKLKKLLDCKKIKEAFICVHNIKGFGLNMSLPGLHKPASELCEAIRHGKPVVDINPLVNNLEVAYNELKEGVLKL